MRSVLLVHDGFESPWPRKHFLESAGYQVDTLASADACLAQLAQCTPDVVVLDVLIEGVNGFELCRRIRSRYKASELPVVMGSDIYVADLFREEASRVGAQAFLVEPRDPEALLAAVGMALVARDADEAQAAA
jgi:CheY-like chemotaxis protein